MKFIFFHPEPGEANGSVGEHSDRATYHTELGPVRTGADQKYFGPVFKNSQFI